MNILVCIKQVPDTAEIKIDPVSHTMIRAGVPSIVNPYDRFALELAARIKDEVPGTTITVLSMGPDQTREALKTCLAVGADSAYLISDRAFAGSDTLATSYALSAAIKSISQKSQPFDLVFCGKQSIDGETAQVGPELAEHLDLPQVTCALDVVLHKDAVRVKRETDKGFEILEVQTPAVITVAKTVIEPRFPTIKSKLAAMRAAIHVMTSGDLPIDRTQIGLAGSPTLVKETFTPQLNKQGVIVREDTNEKSARKLAALLCDAGLI